MEKKCIDRGKLNLHTSHVIRSKNKKICLNKLNIVFKVCGKKELERKKSRNILIFILGRICPVTRGIN